MNNLVLSESERVGNVVYQLEGYDPEGSNVTFGLVGSDNFQVDARTGEVRLIKELDREVSVNEWKSLGSISRQKYPHTQFTNL